MHVGIMQHCSVYLPLCCYLCVRRCRAALGSSPAPTASTLSPFYPLFSFALFPFFWFVAPSHWAGEWRKKTVTYYIREAYQMELQYGFLPCLQVGSDQRPIYLTMEVANLTLIWYSFTSISTVTWFDSYFQVWKIVPGQQYRKKLESQQVSKLMDSTCQHPYACEANICQVLPITTFSVLSDSKCVKRNFNVFSISLLFRLLNAVTTIVLSIQASH